MWFCLPKPRIKSQLCAVISVKTNLQEALRAYKASTLQASVVPQLFDCTSRLPTSSLRGWLFALIRRIGEPVGIILDAIRLFAIAATAVRVLRILLILLTIAPSIVLVVLRTLCIDDTRYQMRPIDLNRLYLNGSKTLS